MWRHYYCFQASDSDHCQDGKPDAIFIQSSDSQHEGDHKAAVLNTKYILFFLNEEIIVPLIHHSNLWNPDKGVSANS